MKGGGFLNTQGRANVWQQEAQQPGGRRYPPPPPPPTPDEGWLLPLGPAAPFAAAARRYTSAAASPPDPVACLPLYGAMPTPREATCGAMSHSITYTTAGHGGEAVADAGQALDKGAHPGGQRDPSQGHARMGSVCAPPCVPDCVCDGGWGAGPAPLASYSFWMRVSMLAARLMMAMRCDCMSAELPVGQGFSTSWLQQGHAGGDGRPG